MASIFRSFILVAEDGLRAVEHCYELNAQFSVVVQRNSFGTSMTESYLHPIDALILQGCPQTFAYWHFWNQILSGDPPTDLPILRVWTGVRAAATMHTMQYIACQAYQQLACLSSTCKAMRSLSATSKIYTSYLTSIMPQFTVPILPTFRNPPTFTQRSARAVARPPYPEMAGTFCSIFPLVELHNAPVMGSQAQRVHCSIAHLQHLLNSLRLPGCIHPTSMSDLHMALERISEMY